MGCIKQQPAHHRVPAFRDAAHPGNFARLVAAARTQVSLAKDAPLARAVQTLGSILPLPVLGGLHHHDVRI
jgi:hypothetical protein